MSQQTNIEWCDHTFNPWEGCTKVGPGCDNCYAEARNARFGGGRAVNWGPGAPRRHTSAGNWKTPLKWEKQAAAFFAENGRRQRVFCASLADVFDNEVPQEWRRELFNLIISTPSLDWLLLTKRIGNAARMIHDLLPEGIKSLPSDHPLAWPWPNVWIGATITSQEEADRDIPKLLEVKASVRFLSMEPLLGPVDLTRHKPKVFAATANLLSGKWKWDGGPRRQESPPIDWVIVGGESGPGARPMHPDWARSLRDQCEEAGVPFLFKQWGAWEIASHANGHFDADMERNLAQWVDCASGGIHKPSSIGLQSPCAMAMVGKKAAGRLLDGALYDAYPPPVA